MKFSSGLDWIVKSCLKKNVWMDVDGIMSDREKWKYSTTIKPKNSRTQQTLAFYVLCTCTFCHSLHNVHKKEEGESLVRGPDMNALLSWTETRLSFHKQYHFQEKTFSEKFSSSQFPHFPPYLSPALLNRVLQLTNLT